MTNFGMTALKPLLPGWLYAGWSRIASDPAMVVWSPLLGLGRLTLHV